PVPDDPPEPPLPPADVELVAVVVAVLLEPPAPVAVVSVEPPPVVALELVGPEPPVALCEPALVPLGEPESVPPLQLVVRTAHKPTNVTSFMVESPSGAERWISRAATER